MEQVGEVLSVLLVEDSSIMGNLLARLMEQEPGLRLVGTLTGAAAALAALPSLKPDVLILDLLLADGSGFDVLRAIAVEHGPRPTILVLTNLPGEVHRQSALDLGAAHFFDKSTDIPVMLQVLRGLASRKPPG